MRRALLALAFLMAAAWAGSAQAARTPVVVELFTSQGCSSCGDADKFLDSLADRPGVLALTLAVDYWNYLGWKDTFARPEFKARQKAYMQRLALREVYTPQIVVDGRVQAAGADSAKIDDLISQAKRSRPLPPSMRLRSSEVSIGSGRAPAGGAEVWLVRYDPRRQEVAVRSGENRGRTLSQRNVVRQLVRLGSWNGRSRRYALEPEPPEDVQGGETLKTCIILQAAKGGRILGVLQR